MSRELNEIAAESVRAHLQAQGVVVEPAEFVGGLRTEEPPLLIHCETVTPKLGTHAAITPVTFTAVPMEGANADRAIYDIVVGLGDDKPEAVARAAHSWCAGVFPAVRRALLPPPAGDGKEAEDENGIVTVLLATRVVATGATVYWNVFLGPAQVGGRKRDEWAQAALATPDRIVFVLLNAIIDGIAKSPHAPSRLHWGKAFVALQADGALLTECRWDNDEWPEGDETLRRHPWPRLGEFVQYRQFFTLAPAAAPNADLRAPLDAQTQEATPSSLLRRVWPFRRS